MILTLTPNPTIDRTVFVRDFAWGQPVRAEREVATPSGKGVDASLVIHELGGETATLGLNAGLTGRLLASMLDERGIEHCFSTAQGETRTATVLVDLARGEQSTISAPTLRATEEALPALYAKLDVYAGRVWGLICGGSLPPGLPLDAYARLVRHARGLGWVTLLDTSGEALRKGVSGLPHVLKINDKELAALVPSMQTDRDQIGDDLRPVAIQVGERLGVWASEALVVTFGDRGVLAVTREGTFHARPPRVTISNTAGAGDALSAGLMLARSRGQSWPAALALGAAAAASVLANEGTAICKKKEVEDLLPQVQVNRID